MDFERSAVKSDEKRSFFGNLGWLVILFKIGPKLLSIAMKLGKFILGAVKAAVGFKTAGAAASLGLYSYLFSWQMGVSLVAFILIHEYGHLWAMKRCGIKTKGIYLIPGFGGAAIADEKFKSSQNEAFIAILGPFFGLFFILPMILLYFLTENPMYAAIASIMSFINLFNLFPINPLDGGRITKSLLYSLHGSVGFFFMLFSLALAVVLTLYAGWGLLVYIAVIGLMETINDYGLKDALASFMKTTLRTMGIWFLYIFVGGLMASVSWWGLLFFGAMVSLFAALFLWDAKNSTEEENYSLFVYPWIVIKDFFRGIKELFSIKPSHLKRIDGHEKNDQKTISFLHSSLCPDNCFNGCFSCLYRQYSRRASCQRNAYVKKTARCFGPFYFIL